MITPDTETIHVLFENRSLLGAFGERDAALRLASDRRRLLEGKRKHELVTYTRGILIEVEEANENPSS